MPSYRRAAVAVLPALALLACKNPAPPPPPPPAAPAQSDLRVTDIDVGRSAADNLFVAVKTEGSAPDAKVAAVWTYEDQRVTEAEQTIKPQGPSVITFELPKLDGPNASWPSGDYKVKILLNGVLAGSETFQVREPSK